MRPVPRRRCCSTVRALPAAEYDAWLDQQVARGQRAAAARIARPVGQPGAAGQPPASGGPLRQRAVAERRSDRRAAKNVAFDDALTRRGRAVHAPFREPGPEHPAQRRDQDASGGSKFKGDIFPGVAAKDYQVPPLAAGTYTFFCAVHPNMTGTLTVQ